MDINEQAAELNESIKNQNTAAFNLLSERGKGIFFPKSGILGQTAEAKGKKINATIGIAIEDNMLPMRLSSISSNVSLPPEDIFPYAPSFGRKDIREKWKEMIRKKSPSIDFPCSMPVAAAGLTHALSIAGFLFAGHSESIIIPDLFWGNYKLIFTNGCGCSFDTFSTFKDEKFNIRGLSGKLNAEGRKKILLLNFPNNPSGYSPDEKEAEEIASVIKQAAEQKEILVIIDDAYFGLVYEDGISRESIFSKLGSLHENVLAVKVDGPTKEDFAWGLRVGFITFACRGMEDYTAIESKAAGAVRGTISNAPNISQSLLLDAFSSASYEKEKTEKYNTLRERYAEVRNILDSHPEYKEEFRALPFNSGYFMCLQLSRDAEPVRQILLERYDTGVISMGNIMRIAFSSCPKQQLPGLFENVYEAARELKKG